MASFPSKLLAFISRKPRYGPEIIWSNNSWTHNVFRFYELIFGRRVGIRAESAVRFTNGQAQVELYTFEAACAYLETFVRNFFQSREWVRIEQFQFANNPYSQIFPSIKFAIALDTSAVSLASTTSPFTWSHTVTGSSTLLAVGVGLVQNTPTQPTVTAVTYNSVGATKARADQKAAASRNYESSIWLLGGPATGANTVSVTATFGGTNPAGGGVSVSYTGAQSGNTADAVNGLTGTTATGAQSFNVTTIADNAWVVAVGVAGGNSGTETLTATQTNRGTVTPRTSTIMRVEDTNAAVTPPGAQAMGFTVSSAAPDGWAMTGASFAPGGTTTSTSTSISTSSTSISTSSSTSISTSSTSSSISTSSTSSSISTSSTSSSTSVSTSSTSTSFSTSSTSTSFSTSSTSSSISTSSTSSSTSISTSSTSNSTSTSSTSSSTSLSTSSTSSSISTSSTSSSISTSSTSSSISTSTSLSTSSTSTSTTVSITTSTSSTSTSTSVSTSSTSSSTSISTSSTSQSTSTSSTSTSKSTSTSSTSSSTSISTSSTSTSTSQSTSTSSTSSSTSLSSSTSSTSLSTSTTISITTSTSSTSTSSTSSSTSSTTTLPSDPRIKGRVDIKPPLVSGRVPQVSVRSTIITTRVAIRQRRLR